MSEPPQMHAMESMSSGPDRNSRRPAVVFAALLFAALMLSSAAILNGFPIIFYDTSTYVDRAGAIAKFLFGDSLAAQQIQNAFASAGVPSTGATYSNPFFLRPFTYSAFLVPLATPYTFLLTPFAQALFVAYVIRRLFLALGIESLRAFLLSVAFLTVFSALPITTAYVMPDVFTGALIVFSFCVVKSWSDRSNLQRLVDVALMTFLVAVHLSHIPITLALAVLFLVASFIFGSEFRRSAIALGVIAPLVVAPMILTASNYVVAKKAVISESSSLFLLGRFVGDGATQAYLRTACAEKKYVLCGEIDRLNDTDSHGSIMDFFLWGKEGVVGRLSDPRVVTEAEELNRETLRAYPWLIVSSSITNTVRQFFAFQVDDDVNNRPAPFVAESIASIDPRLESMFLNSLQSRGAFPLGLARSLSNLGLLISLAAVAYLLATRRDTLGRSALLFGFFAVAGISANALAIGSLSEVHDRYQNRVIWLVPLVAAVFVCSHLFNRAAVSAAASRQDARQLQTPALDDTTA